MTSIRFLGTGEAFDPDRTTTSYLIESGNQTLMIDCGYDAPRALMRYLARIGKSVADVPNYVLFTHEHGDHFGGLTGLLMPIWEEVNGVVGPRRDGLGRKIEIACANEDILPRVEQAMERDYAGFFERFKREGPGISLRKIKPKGDSIAGLSVKAAPTIHSVQNFAYRFTDSQGHSFAISGDGALSDQSRELFCGVDVLIHEGFNVLGSAGKNHASIEQVASYAISARINQVHIVHVNREERKKTDEIRRLQKEAIARGVSLFMAEEDQNIIL
jgi:ribonuclease BN (tRNA processing enzyme)